MPGIPFKGLQYVSILYVPIDHGVVHADDPLLFVVKARFLGDVKFASSKEP